MLFSPNLLNFNFTSYKNIASSTTRASICSAAANNAVIAAESVDHICTGTAQDQVIAFGTGQYAGATDEIRQISVPTRIRLEVNNTDVLALVCEACERDSIGRRDRSHGGD